MIESRLKDNLKSSYDKRTSEREAMEVPEWKLKEREEFIAFLHKEGLDSILEVGAGAGKDSEYFQGEGFSPVCIDLSPEMVKVCRDKGLQAEVMSFDELSFPDQHFDAVWALNCLLHVPKVNLPSVLQEIKRVLKPNGLFYMGVYGGQDSEGIWEGDFYEPKRFFSFFQDEELREVLSQYFHMEYFHSIPPKDIAGALGFQSAILRNLMED
jgi:SAM-dependent methyltransferase